jgi:molybdopterin-biosynthesis enzyme MoeA-like protein
MTIGALIIGDELLSGKRQDKHFAKVIELLAARGMALDWVQYLGDDRARLTAALAASFASGDIVFSFGGIGVTPDDHTRQAAAAALGVGIALHPDAEREIRGRFGEETTPQRLMLGEFPVGSAIIPNPYNRIPGFSIRNHWFFPGFPVMSWPMLERVLDTQLAHLHHAVAREEQAIIVYEAPESALLDLMNRIVGDYPRATLFSLPSFGGEGVRRHIELGMRGEPESVRAAMEEIRAETTRMGFEWAEKQGSIRIK